MNAKCRWPREAEENPAEKGVLSVLSDAQNKAPKWSPGLLDYPAF